MDLTTFHHCCKRCARKKMAAIQHLPQEIIFELLLRLPAQPLHHVMRHVCREWSLIIRSSNFARQHLQNIKGGVIFQNISSPKPVFYLEMRGGGNRCLEMSAFDCGFDGLVKTSCNGLVVFNTVWGDETDKSYVSNPLTKQLTVVPTFPKVGGEDLRTCGLAFAESSMAYKLVETWGFKYHIPKTHILLLTLGLDRAWRHIDIKHLLPSKEESMFDGLPRVTGGYVHWVTSRQVLTLNVETEIVCRFSHPPPLSSSIKRYYFLPMGGSLSFVHVSGKFWWDVWEMDSESGEWRMLFRIRRKPLNDRLKGMFTKYAKTVAPLCWLAAREVLIFGLKNWHSPILAYDVRSGEIIQSFQLEGFGRSFRVTPHVSSLVWWE